MNSTFLTTIAATGFAVAALHAAIPTHWLPFVLVGRARGWSRAQTIGVAVLAGLGHVVITSLLGLLVAWLGFRIGEEVGGWLPWVTGGVLVGVGLFFFFRQWRGRGVCHHHAPGGRHQEGTGCGHEEGHSHWQAELQDSEIVAGRGGDWAAIGGLLVMLTLSPCEGFLPIYLLGVQYGWAGLLVLSGTLAVATLGAMVLLTWLALLGFERLEIRRFERMEAGLLGLLFTVLGLLVVLLEH